jgi:adenylylsulfate kinase
MKPILIMGLPGSGKTALAKELAEKINAVHWNADEVRMNLNKDLGFSVEHRIEQARRMGWLCRNVTEKGFASIADFVCPIPECREAFGDAFIVYVDRIESGRFADTNKMFVPPEKYDVRIPHGLTIEEQVDLVINTLSNMKDFI